MIYILFCICYISLKSSNIKTIFKKHPHPPAPKSHYCMFVYCLHTCQHSKLKRIPATALKLSFTCAGNRRKKI